MRPKVALTIGAVLAFLFGLALTFVPEQMLASFGLASSPAGLVLSRDLGVALVAVGVINWMARNAQPGPALQAILWGNLLVQVFTVVLDSWHITSGQISQAGWAGVGLHAVLGAMFASALWRPEQPL